MNNLELCRVWDLEEAIAKMLATPDWTPDEAERVRGVVRAASEARDAKTASAHIMDFGRYVLLRGLGIDGYSAALKGTGFIPFAHTLHVSEARKLRDALTEVLKHADEKEMRQ